MNRLIFTVCCALFSLVALPQPAHATVPTSELNTVCAAGSPVCLNYTLGGAERFWLMNRKSDKCDTAKDGKTLQFFMKNLPGKDNLYAKRDGKGAASIALLSHLVKNKINVCTPVTRFSELLKQCDSKEKGPQYACHAYIVGVLDMAITLHEVAQIRNAKGAKPQVVPPFCDAGKPKMKMVEAEVNAALAEWRKARPDRISKMPAALEIINALAVKYPCSKDNILK